MVGKRRLTQAERSAGTRARVLKAVVRCLHTYGYSATTTLLVAEEAGISRGAMLHQFPTKTDLMLFVVRSVFDDEVTRYEERLKSPKHSDDDMLEVLWETLNRPSATAVLEILLGSRSDPLLMGKLRELQAQIERESLQIAATMHPNGGELSTAAGVRLFMWVMRGFSIANLLADHPKDVLEMMDLLRQMTAAYNEVIQRVEISKPIK